MTTNQQPAPPTAFPLLPADPPRVDDYWLDSRIQASASGITYLAHDREGSVLLVLMAEGAADDLAARERFAGMVNRLHIDDVLARGGTGQDEGRLAGKYVADVDTPLPPEAPRTAPWVALRNDNSTRLLQATQGILDEVDLHRTAQAGDPSGPGFEHYWIDRTLPGLTRMFPAPWPGRYDRAGWVSLLVSWLLMLLLAAIAVLIAILLFRNEPPQAPPPPVEQSQQSSSSPESSSASPSPESGSPSPESASPTPDSSGSPSPRSKL